jgi:Integrase core domain/HTH-like domain
MKAVTGTLGVTRSNLAERVSGVRHPRGPQSREGDLELAAEIRRLVDARPTYGYRRIAALLKRQRRAAGLPVVNAKRAHRLTDNGSIFAAARTLETATAPGLSPCFTPVESPESNGMAEAFVRTFKRDYVRVSAIPDAATALAAIEGWINDYNEVHPHSRLGFRSPSEYIRAMAQPAACPV